jgi:hypothetical protein
MALVTAGGVPAFKGTLLFPRVGVWSADLDLDTREAVAGTITIVSADGASFQGTARGGDPAYGHTRARIVGGAGGLSKQAQPKHYVLPTMRTVLTDLARSAGETLSPTIAPALLSARLSAWTVIAMTVGEALGALVAWALPAGSSWRVLPDGTLWLGQEAWPEAAVKSWRELDRRPRERLLELALEAPSLMPGTVLAGDRIDYVEARFSSAGVRATAWLA